MVMQDPPLLFAGPVVINKKRNRVLLCINMYMPSKKKPIAMPKQKENMLNCPKQESIKEPRIIMAAFY